MGRQIAKSSPFIIISCLVKMINKTLSQYKSFFRMYININKDWECCTPTLAWHWQSVLLKELPQLFFMYLYTFKVF